MANKIILFFTLLTYGIIVSQSFMYILALKNVQLAMDGSAYADLRKLIDSNMRVNFKYVIYAALLANLLLLIWSAKQPNSLLFITAAIAFLALIADTVLTLKGNLPINDIINGWPAHNPPADWMEQRNNWFNIFQYRQLANIIGFVSLLIGTVFGSK